MVAGSRTGAPATANSGWCELQTQNPYAFLPRSRSQLYVDLFLKFTGRRDGRKSPTSRQDGGKTGNLVGSPREARRSEESMAHFRTVNSAGSLCRIKFSTTTARSENDSGAGNLTSSKSIAFSWAGYLYLIANESPRSLAFGSDGPENIDSPAYLDILPAALTRARARSRSMAQLKYSCPV